MSKLASRKTGILAFAFTALFAWTGIALGQDDSPFSAAVFKEMLPDVSYSATRTMDMQGRGMTHTINQQVSYTPHKEWAAMELEKAAGIQVTSLTLFDEGVMYTTTGSMTTKGEMPGMTSLEHDVEADGKFEFKGKETIDGVSTDKYEFSYRQVQGGETYTVLGTLYRDGDGIPRRVDMNVTTAKGETMTLLQRTSNIEIGPQDPARFVPPKVTSGNMFGAIMGGISGGAAAAGMAGATGSAGATKTVIGKVSGWPGGVGRLVDDNNTVIGRVESDGTLNLAPSGAPNSGMQTLESSGYRCDGATLENGAANYYAIGEFLGVDDGKGNRLGRIVGASSEAVAKWSMNPQENGAVPGYTVKMVYFNQPAGANGVCRGANEKQERKLDWQAGWNIEQMTIVAVGESDFFPVDGPKETIWETVETVPAGTIWIYDSFGSPHEGDLVDQAANKATDTATEEVKKSITKGIRKIFGN